MEKRTKFYVNELIWGREWNRKEVESPNPELINTKEITQFQFYEQSYIIDGEDMYTGVEKKISPMYFAGVRKPISYAIEKAEGSTKEYFTKLATEKGYIYVCQTDYGYIVPMNDDDITLEEYIEQKTHTK